MTEVQIQDKSFISFIDNESICIEINRLAAQVNKEFRGEKVIFVAVLNGAFMFASDLVKEIELDCEITFVKVSSYKGTETTGRVDELIGLTKSLANENVIILEDIVDTGITMDKIYKIIELEEPKTIKVCTLLYKREAHKGKVIPDYVAFEIENKFVVGYGLDYNEEGRNFKEIYQIKQY